MKYKHDNDETEYYKMWEELQLVMPGEHQFLFIIL